MHQRIKIIFCCIFILTGLTLAGCGKQTPDQDKKQEERTYEPVTEAGTESSFDLEQLAIDSAQGLYGLSTIINLENIAAAGAYRDREIILIENKYAEDTVTSYIETFSLETGTLDRFSSFTLPYRQEIFGFYQYSFINCDPLVLYEYTTRTYYVFSENLMEYRTITFPEWYEHSAVYSSYDNSLYYMLNNEQILRRYNLDGIFADQTKEIDIIKDAEVVWRPEVNLGSCRLIAVSDDGTVLSFSAYELVNEVFVDIYYDLKSGTYTDIFEQNYTMYSAWDSFDHMQKLYISYLDDYKQQITYADADTKSSYVCELDLMSYVDPAYLQDENGYYEGCGPAVWLSLDNGCNGMEDFLIFAVMDNYDSSLRDLVLWNYAGQEAQIYEEDPLESYAVTSITDEIDYGELTKKADAIEEQYGIEIVLGENCRNQFINYTAEPITDAGMIDAALDAVANSLRIFPDGFLKEMRVNFTTNIIVYLTGELTPIDPESYIGAIAVTSDCFGYEMITLDITQYGLEETLIHEMVHVIDNWFENNGYEEELDQAWSRYNPEGFDYYYSYFGYIGDFANTVSCDEYWYDNDIEAVYFYDDYAKTYPTEDRARTFEHFYDSEWIAPFYYNSHFKGKISSYLQLLEEHFDSFYPGCNSLWEQMYQQVCEAGA